MGLANWDRIEPDTATQITSETGRADKRSFNSWLCLLSVESVRKSIFQLTKWDFLVMSFWFFSYSYSFPPNINLTGIFSPPLPRLPSHPRFPSLPLPPPTGVRGYHSRGNFWNPRFPYVSFSTFWRTKMPALWSQFRARQNIWRHVFPYPFTFGTGNENEDGGIFLSSLLVDGWRHLVCAKPKIPQFTTDKRKDLEEKRNS
jgi:hypothetical protein